MTLTNQQLAGLAGLYWKPDGDEFVKTYLKDGKLRVSFDPGNDYALKPVSETFFISPTSLGAIKRISTSSLQQETIHVVF